MVQTLGVPQLPAHCLFYAAENTALHLFCTRYRDLFLLVAFTPTSPLTPMSAAVPAGDAPASTSMASIAGAACARAVPPTAAAIPAEEQRGNSGRGRRRGTAGSPVAASILEQLLAPMCHETFNHLCGMLHPTHCTHARARRIHAC